MPAIGLLLLQFAPILVPMGVEAIKKFQVNGKTLKDAVPNGVAKWLWPVAAVGVNGLLMEFPEAREVVMKTVADNPTIATGLMSVGAFSFTKNLRQSAQKVKK